LKIPNSIATALNSGVVFTDLSIREDLPIYYRTPTGYKPVDEEIISKEDIMVFAELADGHWKKRIEDGGGQFDCGLTLKDAVRLRCNFYLHGANNSIGVIIRKLPIDAPDIDKIGTSPSIKRMMDGNPKGLFLVSGPTGSGKSTTLAAIIEHFNRTQAVSVITLEEPIEYEYQRKIANIIQREIPHNVISFEKGVQTAKRQDPDIIMVGEVRDRGTVDAVIAASCSGHLVLATTHARSAQESLEALLSYYTGDELKQKRALLASSLLAITSQVLLASADGKSFQMCYELMHNTPMIATMLREGKSGEITTMMQRANDPMLVSMNVKLAGMVGQGIVSSKEALRVAYDKDGLARMLK
jgi:twitching motility protein PilT